MIMYATHRLWTYLSGLLAASAVTLSSPAYSQVILPAPEFTPGTGSGIAVLTDPFTSNPAPGLFLGTSRASYPSEPFTIFRVTPTDGSSSHFNIEDVDGGLSYVSRFAHNDRGDSGLYAVGLADMATKQGTVRVWKLRASRDGKTWTDADTFFLPPGREYYPAAASGIATTADGTVYVCGNASDGKVWHWIVRRKTKSLQGDWTPDKDWGLVIDKPGASRGVTQCYAIGFFPGNAANPQPALFAVGILNDKWTVLRSQDEGKTWPALQPWPSNGRTASAYDVACDSQGTIYVVGARGFDGDNRGWVVRRSVNGGDNWDTLLDTGETSVQASSWASRVAIDPFGNVTVSGALPNSSGVQRWAVLRRLESWSSLEFPLGDGTYSKGRGVVADSDGNLFLTGDKYEVVNGTSKTLISLVRMAPSALPAP